MPTQRCIAPPARLAMTSPDALTAAPAKNAPPCATACVKPKKNTRPKPEHEKAKTGAQIADHAKSRHANRTKNDLAAHNCKR